MAKLIVISNHNENRGRAEAAALRAHDSLESLCSICFYSARGLFLPRALILNSLCPCFPFAFHLTPSSHDSRDDDLHNHSWDIR